METPSFVCSPCNFSTTLKPNFTRHCNTQKHIKICECEVFTEIKVVSKQDENSILIKMEELMKKNETLEKTMNEMKSTIDILVNVINNLASSVSGSERSERTESVSSETSFVFENEIIEPIETIDPLVKPVLESFKSVESEPENVPIIEKNEPEKPVIRKKNKIALLPAEEKKEEKKENKEEQLRIQRLELELKEMKGKHSEKPEDIIEARHKFMETVPNTLTNRRGNPKAIDCIWDIYNNMSKEYLIMKTSLDFDNMPDHTEEYTTMIINYLKKELQKKEEGKRPIVYYKGELYIRVICEDEDCNIVYKWKQTEMKKFIEQVENIMGCFNELLEYSHDTEVAMRYFMNTVTKEKQHEKIKKAIMPYILMK